MSPALQGAVQRIKGSFWQGRVSKFHRKCQIEGNGTFQPAYRNRRDRGRKEKPMEVDSADTKRKKLNRIDRGRSLKRYKRESTDRTE